jgi:hypothetical protein
LGAANIESVPAEIESSSGGQGFPARPKFRWYRARQFVQHSSS